MLPVIANKYCGIHKSLSHHQTQIMKKYLLGGFAICLAITGSSFKHLKKAFGNYSIEYYYNDGTRLIDFGQTAPSNGNCAGGSTYYCTYEYVYSSGTPPIIITYGSISGMAGLSNFSTFTKVYHN
jgi:hypothetical protein